MAKEKKKFSEREKEAEKLQSLVNSIEKAEGWRDSNFKDNWNDYYRRYCSRAATEKTTSNIFVPTSFMISDVIGSRISESLFANRPYVSVLPRNQQAVQYAKNVEKLLDWQFSERMRLQRTFAEHVIPSLVIYGTAITYTSWLKKTRKSKKRVTLNIPTQFAGMPNMPGAELNQQDKIVMDVEEAVYDDPITQSIDLLNYFVDPKASCVDDARFMGHKEYLSKKQIEDRAKTEGWEIDFEELSSENTVEDAQTIRYNESGKSAAESSDSYAPQGSALYLVHQYWEENRHVVLLNKQQVVLDEENPFYHGRYPYDRACYIYLPGEFYGTGIIELIAALQDELNTVRNQRIDYHSMVLRRMFKIRKGCGLTAKDLVWRQNGIIQVEGMEDVMEINVQGLPASAFANEANIKQDMKDVSGCHDILMGIAGQDETATTTMTKDNNASIRFKMVCTALAEDMLVPIAEKCVSLDQQYMSEEKQIRTLESNGNDMPQSISPFEVEGEYDLIYVGTSVDAMANKELQKQKLMEFSQVAVGDPLYQQDNEARLNLYKRILTAMDVKGVEAIIPDLQKVEAQQAQMQMQQAQGQAPQGMMPLG